MCSYHCWDMNRKKWVERSAHYNCNNIGTNLNPLIDTMFKISPSKTPLASFFYDVATSRQWFASLRGSFCHHAHTASDKLASVLLRSRRRVNGRRRVIISVSSRENWRKYNAWWQTASRQALNIFIPMCNAVQIECTCWRSESDETSLPFLDDDAWDCGCAISWER